MILQQRFFFVALIFTINCLGLLPAWAENWPQFRGPNASGVSTESKNLPVKFSNKENVAWSVELGRGVASPVIFGDRVFVTTMAGEETFAVLAFDAFTGVQLWRKEFATGPLSEICAPNEHSSSTPATDGERVYVHFSTLGMIALSAADGELLWHQELPRPFYLSDHGAANSPIVFQDMILFNLDDDLDPYLIAYDKISGEVRWRTPRPEMLYGYSTPVVCEVGQRTDIVVAGTGKLKGYDPENGRERWTCNSLLRTIIPSPVVEGDRIYVALQSYGDSGRVVKYALLQWNDTNQDGKLEKNEIDEAFWNKFDKGDSDKDGFLVDDEIDHAFQSPTNMVGGGKIIQAIRGGGEGDVTDTHMVWNLTNSAASGIASPLAVDGRLFLVKKGGISAAFDTGSGDKIWTNKRIKNFGNYYASPIAGDGKIYVTGENGVIVVLKIENNRPVVLEKNDMEESCVATPAIANDRLYVRTLNRIFCIANSNDQSVLDAGG